MTCLAVPSAVPPRGYSDPAFHRDEASAIFAKCWVFVGLTSDLIDENNFITVDIAGTSVVVLKSGGELRALHNVCTHRHAKIQQAACGNRKLVCPFHGWTFNRDGALIGVPGNADYFGFDAETKSRLGLRRFEVATRGRFMFVRLNGTDGPSLDAYLGSYGPVLDHFSDLFTNSFEQKSIPWSANWKLGVETVLEPYHVNATHPTTFKRYVGGLLDSLWNGEHSQGGALLSDDSNKWWDGAARRLGLSRSSHFHSYDHFFIFPNLAVAVTAGSMLSIQTYDPTGPESCVLRLRLLMSPRVKTGAAADAMAKAVQQEISRLNDLVLEEDRGAAEACQLGSRQMTDPAILGVVENRISAFHAAWAARLAGLAA